MIYKDLNALREFYSYYVQRILEKEEKDELVQIAPFYETVASVRNTISSLINSITSLTILTDEENILSIIDPSTAQLPLIPAKPNHNTNLKNVQKTNSTSQKKVSILVDNGVFFFAHKIKELIDNEKLISAELDLDRKMICLYHEKDFDRLAENVRQNMIKLHDKIVAIDGNDIPSS
ncbi:MAG TPA: hypothetical protein VFT71_06365 [Candidatus Nitrosocosmicus sp.]|nr:hypothetical protein [Candidatus Nitrosocosmicus sp.]